ncbi:NAD-dependent epimerase/dehydratase family protein [Candidatus Dojkabacteria bacterium]|nr:NAD-dependent epimerase/dehydratase family protein [Candidatus Dojkabacteria bacterium]
MSRSKSVKKALRDAFEEKRILVTGGCGFIGANLIKKLKIYTSNIICVDDLSANSGHPQDEIDFVELNVSDFDSVSKLFNEYKFDYIFHLAAHFANQNSVEHPVEDMKTNLIGTYNLLENTSINCPEASFIFSSSSCVYGDGNLGFAEDNKIGLLSTPYAIHKYASEKYCEMYTFLNGIRTINIRYFNVFGPGEKPGKYRNVIPNFIHNILCNKPIVLFGDGKSSRLFTFVDDAVEMTLFLALNGKKGELYNVGIGDEVKIIDLAKKIYKLTEKESQIIWKPERYWDITKVRRCSIEKLHKLGYDNINHCNFDDALKKTIDYIKSLDKEL